MDINDGGQKPPDKKNLFQKFDGLLQPFIPNFNVRAILYITFIFAVAAYLEIWRISPSTQHNPPKTGETVIADNAYWQSKEYKDKIQNQSVQSFTSELQGWLGGKSSEFVKRKFEDIVYINSAETAMTGGDPSTIVPQNFNYLENIGKARYKYAKNNGFVNDPPVLVALGNVVCDIAEKTEKATGLELYDWRYASMPKLAAFMVTKPDWKIQEGDTILDISEPNIEDKDILKSRNVQTQPAGLFSFLVFHDPKTNRIFLADSEILENNGIDSRLTLSRLTGSTNKLSKLYFKYGYEGCSQINSITSINYGQPD